VKTAQCYMQRADAPPGFWPWDGPQTALLDGAELESAVRTRFFQTVDPYPSTWGTLHWRIQLNNIVDDRVALPFFRASYPGVEWNLKHPGGRWFLTAWFKWERAGESQAYPSGPPRIEGDTVLFAIPMPDTAFDGSLHLRSRVDARDRRSIAESVRTREQTPTSDPTLIVLDDVIDAHRPS
jgi:hypothetical protein